MTAEQYYGGYDIELKASQAGLQTRLEKILKSLAADPEQAPAEHFLSRIKSPESAAEKLRRRGLPEDADSAIQNLTDLIGVRIVTHFVGDVYRILEEIRKSSEWRILTVKDYISCPKPNGYRSLHILLEIPFPDDEIPMITAEIQMRTIAMDCWASLEHQMRYKKHISGMDTGLIESELKRCADEMASTDLTMQTIREMIQSQ